MTAFEETMQRSRQIKLALIGDLDQEFIKFRNVKIRDEPIWVHCYRDDINCYDDIDRFYNIIKSQIHETLSGHSAIGAILCNVKNIDKKTSVIAILLMFSYKPTPKDLQIAQVNFYDALSSDDIERLIFIIKIFNRQDFCKIIIKFLIYYLMIKYTPYLPSLLY